MAGLRWESRLEGAIETQIRTRDDHRYTVALMPWLVLHQGALQDRECDGCSLELLDIESSVGLAIALAGAWQLD